MRKLIYVALVIAIVWSWREGYIPGFGKPGAYDDQGNPAVLVFTFDDCGQPCKLGIKELKKRGVPFQELVVDPNNKDDKNYKLWQKHGKGSFPFIVAGKQTVIGDSKAQLASLLGENFGRQYLTRSEKRYFKKHFYEDGTPKIVMYGTDWCPGCKRLREEFDVNAVDYFEVDVEKSGELDFMLKTMEIGGYPAIWVGYTRVRGVTLSAVRKTRNSI